MVAKQVARAQKIAIIGAGFSGTALAANLCRLSSEQSLEIFLFEKRPQFGLGDAYSTPHSFHLLNVRADDMSAFEDDPEHFMRWLRTQNQFVVNETQPLAEQYLPRLWYGRYLQTLLHDMLAAKNVNWKVHTIAGEVVDVALQDEQVKIILQNEETFIVDQVVLALGNHPPAPFNASSNDRVQCIQEPWNYGALQNIHPEQPVLILGTGLSMIDTVLTLHHQQHTGKITALSRRGLIPLLHANGKSPMSDLPSLPLSLRELTKQIRLYTKACMQMGIDWRSIITSLRAQLPAYWQKASVKDKQQFMRHVLPYWNIHRHRVHQSIGQLLEQLKQTGQLQIIAGRMLRIHADAVEIQKRYAAQSTQLPVNWVINCMGPSLTINAHASTLTRSILTKGIGVTDPLKLGFAVDQNGALQNVLGQSSKQFFTLGAPSKGTAWESTAVPDIRKQCLTLAKHLLHLIKNKTNTSKTTAII